MSTAASVCCCSRDWMARATMSPTASSYLPFGVGLEIFPSNNASIVLDGGYRVTDDYPDDLKRGNLDGYATAKLGVNLYIGTGYEDEEAQHLRDAEERHAKQLAEVEELRLKQQADADA